MATELNKIGELDGIDLYFDQTMENGEFLILIKRPEQTLPGYVCVPTKLLQQCEGIPIPDISDYKKQQTRKEGIENVKAILGFSDNIEFYKQVIEKIKAR